MVEYDPSWTAVLRPGRGQFLFPRIAAADRSDGERILASQRMVDVGVIAFDVPPIDRREWRSNAARADILRRVGLVERQFVTKGGAQCAIFTPELNSEHPSFTAVVFRGSQGLRDWSYNLRFVPKIVDGMRLHRGFVAALDVLWSELLSALNALDGPFVIAGHSLGGALATLAAARRSPQALYTFGAPRVGGEEVQERLKNVCVCRLANARDIVTAAPPRVKGMPYRHVEEDSLCCERNKACGDDDLRRRRRWFHPPSGISDHAPVNYSARIERELGRSIQND